jgi:hypothetical protein
MKEAIICALILAPVLIFLGMTGFVTLEPQTTQAATTSAVTVSQTVIGEIVVACDSTTTLPSLSGQTGGTATTTFNCTSTSNNATGWILTLKYDHKLRKGAGTSTDQYFDDYTTSTDVTDYTWDSVGSGNEEFGFSVNSGTSTVLKYRDNGSDTCNTSTAPSAFHCFHPFSASEETIADSSSPTVAGGELYVIGLQDEAGTSNNLESGSYGCTITATIANQ